jgi:hypothetical protein
MVAKMPFHTSAMRKPKRRSRRGAMLFIASDPQAVATVMVPLRAAEKPKASCIISGSRKGWAPWVTRVIDPAITERRKVWSFSKVRSRMAPGLPCAWRR